MSGAIEVGSIHDLSKLLISLESKPNMLVIRGSIQDGVDPKQWHQRTKLEPVNYLTPHHGLRFAMIDIDKLPLPQGMLLTPQTIEAAIEHVISRLPKELHDVTFHWQLSSSAGIHDQTVISVHLWFWFDRPVTDADLKKWGKDVNTAIGYKLIDWSLFNDVQAHYTAAPLFEGLDDPFPVRSGLVIKSQDCASLRIQQPQQKAATNTRQKTTRHPTVTGRDYSTPVTGFEGHLALIGDHHGGEGFHLPLIRAAASYIATHGAENTDVEVLYKIIRERVLSADRSHHTLAEVEQRASREHIIPAIDGALKKYGEQPERAARVIEGIKPHYTTKSVPKHQAHKKLKNMIDKLF